MLRGLRPDALVTFLIDVGERWLDLTRSTANGLDPMDVADWTSERQEAIERATDDAQDRCAYLAAIRQGQAAAEDLTYQNVDDVTLARRLVELRRTLDGLAARG